MCCGVVPILFGWFLRVPSLHALVFIRKTFLWLSIIHLPQKCYSTSKALYIGLVTGTFYGLRPALCTSVHRTPPPSLLVGWGSLLQTPCSITEAEKKLYELVPCLQQTVRNDQLDLIWWMFVSLIPRQGRRKSGLVSAHALPVHSVVKFMYVVSQYLNEIVQLGYADGQLIHSCHHTMLLGCLSIFSVNNGETTWNQDNPQPYQSPALVCIRYSPSYTCWILFNFWGLKVIHIPLQCFDDME